MPLTTRRGAIHPSADGEPPADDNVEQGAASDEERQHRGSYGDQDPGEPANETQHAEPEEIAGRTSWLAAGLSALSSVGRLPGMGPPRGSPAAAANLDPDDERVSRDALRF